MNMTRMTRSKQARLVAGFTAIGGALLSVAASAVPLERHAERPATQAGSAATTSFMERTFNLPTAGFLEFRYFVDSQQAHDFLRVYVGGALSFQQSGEDRIGRVRKDLTAGSHSIRFAYEKDATGSTGRDTAQLDDITVKTSKGQEVFRFDSPSLGAPQGWTTGGAAGGWQITRPSIRRGLQRPASAAFAGYNAAGLVSSTQRSITWPAGASKNLLKLGFQVDSEEGKDFFRVYVDGVQKFSESGAGRAGVTTLDVGAPGAHVIRFTYEKDESVDEGLDDARVLRMEAIADGQAFQLLDLDQSELGTDPPGWVATNSSEQNWTVAPGLTALAYALPGSAQPTVDGQREPAYVEGSRLRLGDLRTTAAQSSKLQALLSGTSLFLHAQIAAGTAHAGDESGTVTLYLDRERTNTRIGLGCSGAFGAPGPEARKIVVSYDIPDGARTADATTQQYVGSCSRSAPWVAADPAQALSFDFAAIEPEHEALLGLELRVDAASPDDTLGVGLTLATGEGVTLEMPALDAQPVSDADVTTWATLFSTPVSARGLPPGVVLVGAPRQSPAPE